MSLLQSLRATRAIPTEPHTPPPPTTLPSVVETTSTQSPAWAMSACQPQVTPYPLARSLTFGNSRYVRNPVAIQRVPSAAAGSQASLSNVSVTPNDTGIFSSAASATQTAASSASVASQSAVNNVGSQNSYIGP